MKRHPSSHSHRDEKPRSSCIEAVSLCRCDRCSLSSRTEEKTARRRREWRIQQEREEQYNQLRQKKISEYEVRRAREKGIPLSRRRSSHSRSTSRSPRSRHRRASTSRTPLSEKLESSSGTTRLFMGPEGTQISATELRKTKVYIYRNIPCTSTSKELQWDIVNPEDVVVIRRVGEGSKSIFERENIRTAVEEYRTVTFVTDENLEGESKTAERLSSTSSWYSRICNEEKLSLFTVD